jgi:hypothetical protein
MDQWRCAIAEGHCSGFLDFVFSMHDFKGYSEMRLTCNARLCLMTTPSATIQYFASLSIKKVRFIAQINWFQKGYPDFQSITRSRYGPLSSRAAGSEQDPKQTKSCFVIASDICNIRQTTLPESYLINELIVSGTSTTIDDVISTLKKPTRSSP